MTLAMISPNLNAVPLGASSLNRWWRSIISTSAPEGTSFKTRPAVSASFIARLTARLMLGAHTSGIVLAASRIFSLCTASSPVVATTKGICFSRQMAKMITPASAPNRGCAACSKAATSFRSASALAKAMSRCPMRPAAPWIAMRIGILCHCSEKMRTQKSSGVPS